jgi:hypothetical protein
MVVAQGLCAKHYMRMRQTGDPNKTGKRGRPRGINMYLRAHQLLDKLPEFYEKETNDPADPAITNWIDRICTAQLIPMASPRTQARWNEALNNLYGCSAEGRSKVLQSCIRPNGSLNVSKLLEQSIDLWDREHPQEHDDPKE